jgi:hypothetical protein
MAGWPIKAFGNDTTRSGMTGTSICHPRTSLAGIQITALIWIPDKSIRE